MFAIADDRRTLTRHGRRAFWLGDTAWELFHRLDLDDATHYLQTRARQGFNVVQAVALAECDGLTVPTPDGLLPLDDQNPATPRDDYFDHVVAVVDAANEAGLCVAVLPTWGRWVEDDADAIFDEAKAHTFGRYLARRLRGRDVVWVVGGDRTFDRRTVWRSLAEGLKDGDDPEQPRLFTAHPRGSESTAPLDNEPWLQMHTAQTGHYHPVAETARLLGELRRLPGGRPFLDSEPPYESHPISFREANGYFDERDVRRAAHEALIEGACGHTYGCHEIWMMAKDGDKWNRSARSTWRATLDLPGANQMRHVRDLALSRPRVEPDAALVAHAGSRGFEMVAGRSQDRSCVIAYSPIGLPGGKSAIDLTPIGGRARAWRYDPVTGHATDLGEQEGVFHPEPNPTGPDAAYVLDTVNRRPPGATVGQVG